MNSDVVEFINDDAGYLRWLSEHPGGYVLNTEKSKNPSYMVLHGAWCQSIIPFGNPGKPGRFTERDYIKICAPDEESLRNWVRQHGRPDGSFSSEGCYCVN